MKLLQTVGKLAKYTKKQFIREVKITNKCRQKRFNCSIKDPNADNDETLYRHLSDGKRESRPPKAAESPGWASCLEGCWKMSENLRRCALTLQSSLGICKQSPSVKDVQVAM